MQPQSIFVTRVWWMCERIWGADDCNGVQVLFIPTHQSVTARRQPLLLDALPTGT